MKKLLALILCLLMLVSLCACVVNGDPTEPPTVPPSDEPTEGPTEDRSVIEDDALFEGEKLRISYKGNCSYVIYCPDPSHYDAALALQNALNKVAGARLTISTSSPKKLDKTIIVGPCEFENSKYEVDSEALGPDGFTLKVTGSCVVIRGMTAGASIEAVYTLVNDYFGFDAIRDSKVTKRTTIYLPSELDRNEYRSYSSGKVLVGETSLSEFVIRINNSATDDERTAANYLRSSIQTATGVQIKLLSDLITPNAYEYEILVGATRREAATGMTVDRASMKDGEYVIKGNGKTILITGKDAASTISAVRAFVEDQLKIVSAGFMSSGNGEDIVIPTDLKVASTQAFDIYQSTEFNIETLMADNFETIATKQCFSDESYINAEIAYFLADVNDSVKYVRCIFNTYTTPCDCDACKAAAQQEGTDYGAYYRFVNKLADALKEKNPTATLEILAYKNTFAPPKTALRDNVSVLLCDKHLCSAHALDNPDCPTNASFVQTLEAWKQVSKSIYVIDCTSDYYYYPVTFPNWNNIYDNVRFYASSGVDGVYYKVEGTSDLESILEFRGMRQYLVKQMMKNTNVSRDTFSRYIAEYLETAFGSKGWKLRAYMDKFSEAANTKCYDIYTKPEEILPIPRIEGKTGVESYDLTLAKEFYDIWNSASPYSNAVYSNDTDLGKMIFRYFCEVNKSENTRHAKVQFNEWLSANVELFDLTEVVNYLIG